MPPRRGASGLRALNLATFFVVVPARLDDFDGLGQAADVVPAYLIAQAAGELGEEHVLWRDI